MINEIGFVVVIWIFPCVVLRIPVRCDMFVSDGIVMSECLHPSGKCHAQYHYQYCVFFSSFSRFIRCFYTFWCFVSRGHVKTFQTDFTAIQRSEYQTWYPIFYQFFTFQACNSISETNVWNCNAYDKSNQYSLSFKQTKQTIYLRYSALAYVRMLDRY